MNSCDPFGWTVQLLSNQTSSCRNEMAASFSKANDCRLLKTGFWTHRPIEEVHAYTVTTLLDGMHSFET